MVDFTGSRFKKLVADASCSRRATPKCETSRKPKNISNYLIFVQNSQVSFEVLNF